MMTAAFRGRDRLARRLPLARALHPVVGDRLTAATAVARGFIAGFLSTVVFRQGVLTLFWSSGILPRVPYDMTRVPPLGVPAVVCLAFWGGIWGVVLSPLLRHAKGAAYWTRAVLFGAVVPECGGPLRRAPAQRNAVGGWVEPRCHHRGSLAQRRLGTRGCALEERRRCLSRSDLAGVGELLNTDFTY